MHILLYSDTIPNNPGRLQAPLAALHPYPHRGCMQPNRWFMGRRGLTGAEGRTEPAPPAPRAVHLWTVRRAQGRSAATLGTPPYCQHPNDLLLLKTNYL
ncbi:hypothetical protein E2C01_002063 [Portunus trituberculatus]|uniref:Uncharacterized protein n=1 Tax=Portunus trituberculatus TaxID=210409 RepID=A0A5B7CKX9_PORTR|nr:hypothetical protein [Portunus trituberculatus]